MEEKKRRKRGREEEERKLRDRSQDHGVWSKRGAGDFSEERDLPKLGGDSEDGVSLSMDLLWRKIPRECFS